MLGKKPVFGRSRRLYRGLRARPGVPLWIDVLNGALLGDFAGQLGLAGALTQITLSFIPVVGDVTATRDLLASWRRRSLADVILNLLALVPIVGGMAKVVELTRGARRLGRVFTFSRPAPRDAAISTSTRRDAA